MKLLSRIVAIFLGAALFAVLLFVTFFPLQRPAPDLQVQETPELVERGRYLAVNVLQCVDCHSERDWTFYGGPPREPLGAGRACMTRETAATGVSAGQTHFPGRMCIRNITPDKETGIGAWTDGEIIRAVREGVNRDGEGLFPIMPYFIYSHVADEDMEAVVAYLRTLQPVKSVRPERDIDFPMSLLVRLLPRPADSPAKAPDRSDSVAYGEYLATIGRCKFCHTPKKPRSTEGYPGRDFAGGIPFFLNGRTMYTMNLTPHESGLGNWSREQFVQLFKSRAERRPTAETDNTLMNWNAFGAMTEEDLGALYDFFMSLPPVPYQEEPV